MKKKIIALILVIPLLLMFTMFNVGEAATIVIDVSVSSISLEYAVEGDVNENVTVNGTILTIDMADTEQTITFATTIKPYNAVSGAVYTVTSHGDNGGLATLDRITGELIPIKTGKVKVTVTATDGLGRFSDSVIVNITSTKPTDIILTHADGDAIVLTDAGFYSISANFRQFNTIPISVQDDLNNQYAFNELTVEYYWEKIGDDIKSWEDISAQSMQWHASCPYLTIGESGQLKFVSGLDSSLTVIYIRLALTNGTWNGLPIYRIVRIDKS
ncbi:MAG: hypothetical protein PHW00_00325 [Clostridia bacterium]|nr:hypothetical protein [Clostridia bacterium]